MEDEKKQICPQCGQETKCVFSGRVVDSVFLKETYILLCTKCGRRETKQQHAGHHIGKCDFPQKTVCPFCGKPPENHKGLSSGEVSRLLRKRERVDGNLRVPPRRPQGLAVCDASALRSVVIPRTPRLTLAPPPRVKTRRSLMKTWKFLTRWSTMKLMAVFTIVYTLALGTLVFTAKLWDEAPVRIALQETMLPTTIVAAWMIICSVLIVRYSRKHYGEL